jgi:hypothetical protein
MSPSSIFQRTWALGKKLVSKSDSGSNELLYTALVILFSFVFLAYFYESTLGKMAAVLSSLDKKAVRCARVARKSPG